MNQQQELHNEVERLGALLQRTNEQASKLVAWLITEKLHIVCTESCTGGALAFCLTNTVGAGEVIRDSFVVYSDEAKQALGVALATIEAYSVYSPEVALAMAQAGIKQSVGADIGVGITGSLSRVDPANSHSTIGEVFVGIIYYDKAISEKMTIATTDRTAAKLEVLKRTLTLLQMLAQE